MELQGGYTISGGSVALLPIEAAGQVRSEAFAGPYFVAVRASNPSPVSVQISGVGIDIGCGAQVVLHTYFLHWDPAANNSPSIWAVTPAGAVVNAAELGHSCRTIAEQGWTPQRVRAFARAGSGALFHGPWIPFAALLPFLTTVSTEWGSLVHVGATTEGVHVPRCRR